MNESVVSGANIIIGILFMFVTFLSEFVSLCFGLFHNLVFGFGLVSFAIDGSNEKTTAL